ncbi:hypothetical protein C0Q70_08083 [Pomacea canaliculata]|uniref:EF-hand domain-containing protein n=1 Tax=Pomacea canaliculata TaxID=400727 RepID=A0A2T7PGU0_POMCA|nr:hypothetical protein C0Q70_08083 [Pomacea canaliculata]
MTSSFDISDSSEIRELFRSFDRNHDNTICAGELGKVLRCLGMNVSEADVQQIIKELDKNRNGKIEYKEFKAFMQEEMRKAEDPAEQEKAVRMAFRVFDQNGDGFIDVKELQNAMKNLGEPLTDKELTDMMKEADMDKDGKINYEALPLPPRTARAPGWLGPGTARPLPAYPHCIFQVSPRDFQVLHETCLLRLAPASISDSGIWRLLYPYLLLCIAVYPGC